MSTLVTGANGYIASEIIYHLLDRGKQVIGSVRSEQKTEPLRKVFPTEVAKGQLKFVYASLTDKPAIEQIFKDHKDIVSVIHVSTAKNFGTKNYRTDIVEPAIEGTKIILNAVYEHAPQVKRFVYSSSVSAMYGEHDEDLDYTYSAKDWFPLDLDAHIPDVVVGYCLSKKYAEKECYQFVQDKKVNFELKSLVIPLVLGALRLLPVDKSGINTSNTRITGSFDGSRVIDVEEQLGGGAYGHISTVASAHVQASDPALSPSGHRRYLITSGAFGFQQVYDILQKLYPSYNLHLPKNPKFASKLYNYNDEETRQDFNLIHKSLEYCIKDICDQYLAIPNAAH